VRRAFVALSVLLLGVSLGSSALHAQADRVSIQVTDVRGNAIPFAFVQITKGVSRVADDSGRAVFSVKNADSLNLQVRRIGFDPFSGWTKRRNESGAFVVDLITAPTDPRSGDDRRAA